MTSPFRQRIFADAPFPFPEAGAHPFSIFSISACRRTLPDGNGIFIDAPETYYIVREPDGRLTTRPEREFNREFEPKGVSVPKEPGDKGCGNCANFTNEDVNGNGYCEAFKCEQSCGVMPCQEYKPKNQ